MGKVLNTIYTLKVCGLHVCSLHILPSVRVCILAPVQPVVVWLHYTRAFCRLPIKRCAHPIGTVGITAVSSLLSNGLLSTSQAKITQKMLQIHMINCIAHNPGTPYPGIWCSRKGNCRFLKREITCPDISNKTVSTHVIRQSTAEENKGIC